MTRASDELETALDAARDYLQRGSGEADHLARRFAEVIVKLVGSRVDAARSYLQDSSGDAALLSRDLAEVIVKIAGSCAVGARCDRHGGAVHGQEAEALRSGVERILKNTSSVRDDEGAFVLREVRKSLVFLLDYVDARDSLAFCEVTASEEDAASCA